MVAGAARVALDDVHRHRRPARARLLGISIARDADQLGNRRRAVRILTTGRPLAHILGSVVYSAFRHLSDKKLIAWW